MLTTNVSLDHDIVLWSDGCVGQKNQIVLAALANIASMMPDRKCVSIKLVDT